MTRTRKISSAIEGETIEMILWEPQGQPRGIVQLVHGMAEHIGRYDEAARFLCGQGFAVVGHTHGGHGPQASILGFFGKRGGWDSLLADIHQVRERAQAEWPQTPYYILGHSMGSFLTRCYILAHSQGLAGAALSGTGYYPPAMTLGGLALARLYILLGQGMRRAKLIDHFVGGEGLDWLSRDEEQVRKYAQDPYCGFLFTAYGYRDLFDGLNRLSHESCLKGLPPTLPIYLFSGNADPVGQMGRGVPRVAEQYRRAGLQDVTVKIYPGGRHEMLNELNRQQVLDDLAQWLTRELPG